jgi:hypothetical protein
VETGLGVLCRLQISTAQRLLDTDEFQIEGLFFINHRDPSGFGVRLHLVDLDLADGDDHSLNVARGLVGNSYLECARLWSTCGRRSRCIGRSGARRVAGG